MKRLYLFSVILVVVILLAAALFYLWPGPSTILVTIDSQGRTFLNDRAVSRTVLEDRLREAVELCGSRMAYVKADPELKYEQIMPVVNNIMDAGFDTVGMSYDYPKDGFRR